MIYCVLLRFGDNKFYPNTSELIYQPQYHCSNPHYMLVYRIEMSDNNLVSEYTCLVLIVLSAVPNFNLEKYIC